MRVLLARSVAAGSIHVAIILYVGILNVWHHKRGKIASGVAVRGDGGGIEYYPTCISLHIHQVASLIVCSIFGFHCLPLSLKVGCVLYSQRYLLVLSDLRCHYHPHSLSRNQYHREGIMWLSLGVTLDDNFHWTEKAACEVNIWTCVMGTHGAIMYIPFTDSVDLLIRGELELICMYWIVGESRMFSIEHAYCIGHPIWVNIC